jgi:glyoxylase-like metal-dependent hydrolase (beta-lactamase superfamily II)
MAAPRFLTLDDVEYGRADRVAPSIRRVIANNPSKFTYRGTGTYVVGDGDVVVIDPGPELDSHRTALGRALAGERVRAILVTHCHADHSPLARWLSAETGAPTYAYGPHPRPDPALEPEPDDPDADTVIEESTDYEFLPDHRVGDGEMLELGPSLRFEGVHTPGHTSNHMCWAIRIDDASVLFTGDHVMGWSTTVVSPPDGDMTAYLESLQRVVERGDDVLWPTHGPARTDGAEYVRSLIEHRLRREAAVLESVRAGRATIPEIVEVLYADVRPELHKPAGRSVWAHLVRLAAEGLVEVDGLARLDATYRPARSGSV